LNEDRFDSKLDIAHLSEVPCLECSNHVAGIDTTRTRRNLSHVYSHGLYSVMEVCINSICIIQENINKILYCKY